MRKTSSPRGFTLIEILLGLSLTVLLLGIIFSALRLAHRSEEKGRARQETAQRMRVLSDRLSWLLRGAYPYVIQKEAKRYVFFDGDPRSVSFVTTSTDPYSEDVADLPGLKWVRIYADSEGLKVAERLFFLEEGESHYLLDGEVESASFEFLEEDEERSLWVSSWSGADMDGFFPRAVRVSLTLRGDGGKEVAMPLIVAPVRAESPIKP